MLSGKSCTATLQHLVADTIAPGRGMTANELLEGLSDSDDLRDGAVALDSLDQLALARKVAEFFELQKAGTEEFLLRRHRLGEWAELITESLSSGLLTHFWFRSGGTTGEPRLLAQPIEHLRAEVSEISDIVPGTHRIVSLVPLHHIYGFIWGPLLSDQLGVPLIHGPKAVEAAHHGFHQGDLVLGVPEWWQYLGRSHNRISEGVVGVTSTAPCPTDVIHETLRQGLESMIEIYGSSETAGIGWRTDTNKGFQLFRHWERFDNDHLESAQGRICSLPDRVQWETDRSVVPGRRHDNAVQVGGVNVWPDRIRDFMESHPQVKACTVRPLNTENGTRLKAFIVPVSADQEALTSELRAWITTNLPAAERPIHLTLGDELPRNPMGKLCDW